MTEPMTLERVRDYLREDANYPTSERGFSTRELTEMADAIDAHLAQPAQAVDVGAIREVIAEIHGSPLAPGLREARDWADKLTRALSGEKAGRVEGWRLVPTEPTKAMAAAFRADAGSPMYFTHTTLQCADFDSRYRAMLAASPAPDKEGL